MTLDEFLASLPPLRQARRSEVTLVGYIGAPGLNFRYGGGIIGWRYAPASTLLCSGARNWEWETPPPGGEAVWGTGEARLLVLDRKGKYVWAFCGRVPSLVRRATPADLAVLPRTSVATGTRRTPGSSTQLRVL